MSTENVMSGSFMKMGVFLTCVHKQRRLLRYLSLGLFTDLLESGLGEIHGF